MRVLLLLASALSASAADYATYIGDAYSYHVTAMTTDAGGNTYLTGSRAIVVPVPTSLAGPLTDVFVSKVDASGNLTLLATLSGKGSDQANGIALDSSGNIYIVGITTSTNFPLHNPFQASSSGSTGFLVKMSSDGTVLYSTYLGGTLGPSVLNAVAADSQGNAYVTGETYASDYLHSAGLPGGVARNGVPATSVALLPRSHPPATTFFMREEFVPRNLPASAVAAQPR